MMRERKAERRCSDLVSVASHLEWNHYCNSVPISLQQC